MKGKHCEIAEVLRMQHSIFRNAALCAAAILALGVSACSGSSTPSAVPAQINSARSTVEALQPAAPVYKTYTAGTTPGFLKTAAALDVTPGANNSVWFTDGGTPAIGTIASNGAVREFTHLPLHSSPYSIVSEKNGTAWFTDTGNGSLGRITTGGAVTEFTNPQLSGTVPQDLTIAPDQSIWYISTGPSSFLAHAGSAGIFKVYSLPATFSYDGSLISDASGNLWFLATNSMGKAVLMERRADGSLVSEYTNLNAAFEPCCPNLAPKRMTIGPDGNLWFTMLDYIRGSSPANWIVQHTSSGLTYYLVHSGKIDYPAFPSGITTSGQKVWFTGDDPFQVNGGLWSLRTDGTEVAYPIPYNAAGLTTGDDGNLWFTAHFGGNPSQIVEAVIK